MPIEPQPCAGSGAGGDSVDVEQTLLCDVLPNGDVVGSALAVYEYDSVGNPVGAPTFVDPVTGLPYVPQGVLQPCDGTISQSVEILCDVNDADGSAVPFERVKTIGPTGSILSVADFGLDGAPYTPLNTVQVCDPYSNCTPESNQDLNAECGPGEPVVTQVLLDDTTKPLANSVFNDDATADPLCGGTWDRPASALPAGFPVAETFRNTTFDQPGPVTQGQPNPPFLTAGPPTNDGPGAGWIRLSDGSYASNGIWQVPAPFSTSEGMNAAVTLASHDGTTPGGDGQYFVFTDGAAGTQATPIGGFGNLGLNNWTGGVFAVVLDEYGQSCSCGQALPSDPNAGPCGFCPNTISIQRAGASRVGASCSCCTIASAPLAPKSINLTTRSQPLRLLTSVISEGGQTYVSASVDWNDGVGPVQYFDRVNITSCITVPPTLRMGLSMNSGGAYQAVKEARDAVARPAGVSNWRAFPITTDPIPACVTLVNISASVDVTPNDDGSQTAGNGNPELYFWLVNTATNTVLDRDEYSIIPSQLGQVQTLKVNASVPVADVPNLRLYVGAESRDDNGEYDTTWENLTVDATGAGCPATPRRTMEISARCPIPVTIVGGGTEDGGGGGTTVVNTPSTFEDQIICATVGGVPQTAFRREVRTPDGGIEVTFLGFNGLPITPDGGWTPGPCPPDEPGRTLGPVCYTEGFGSTSGFMTLDADGNPVLYSASGTVVPEGTYTIVICPLLTQQSHVLCDAGNAGHQFLRWYVDSPISGIPDAQWDFELDGSTPYVPVGQVGICGSAGSDAEVVTLCDFTGDPPVIAVTAVGQAPAPAGDAPFPPVSEVNDWVSGVSSTLTVPTWGTNPPTPRRFNVQYEIQPPGAAPCGPPTLVHVKHTFSVRNTGQGSPGSGTVGLSLRNGATIIDSQTIGAFASGSTVQVTLEADVPYGDVVAGNIDVYHSYLVWQPTIHPAYELSNYSLVVTDIAADPSCVTAEFTQFLRHFVYAADGSIASHYDTTLEGSPYLVTGTVGVCQPATADTPDCGTASSVGTVCYTPPVAVQTLQDDWTGATSVVGGGSRVWTNPNFAGQGITVTETVTPDTGAALLGAGVRNTATSPATQHTVIDLGAPRTNVTVRLDFFGNNQGERLRNVSPAFAAVSGNGTAVLANTGVDGGPAGDGTVFLNFPGPVQTISWDYAPTGGGLSSQTFISFNTGNASNSAPAAVLRDCDTGATTYVDLATGTVLNPAVISIVDCPGDQAGTTIDQQDVEILVLCDSTPTRFLRALKYDAETGALQSVANTTLDGATPFVPVGTVGVCTTAIASDFDFLSTVLCDANGTQFIQRLTFNSATGAVTATTNTTLTGAAFAPVGAVALCSNCCPVVMGSGCTNTGSGFYTAIRATNGTISLIDSVTGATVLPANIVACPSDNTVRTLTAQARTLTNATPWTPGADVAGTLTSLTVTGVSGLWDLVDSNGTALTGLPAGLTLTWSVEDDNQLTGPTSVTPQAGSSVVANWTQR